MSRSATKFHAGDYFSLLRHCWSGAAWRLSLHYAFRVSRCTWGIPSPGPRVLASLRRFFSLLPLAILLLLPLLALAQEKTPHLIYVYPAGGQVGTELEVSVAGKNLGGVNSARITGSGVRVAVMEYSKPLTPQEIGALHERFKALLEKKAAAMQMTDPDAAGKPSEDKPAGKPAEKPTWTPNDERDLAEVRRKLAMPQRKASSPTSGEYVSLKVTVSADAEPGRRELRLLTAGGISNPVAFCIDQLPEIREPLSDAAKQIETTVNLPVIVNGQVMPGAVDQFRFKARKGQKLVFSVMARELIPYLADAVPGWFQANISLKDSAGNELAYADHFHFHPDPVLYQEIPADGQYVLEIRDSLYRGREDFVYRIAMGELPFVSSIFPLGGKQGEQTSVQLIGWNLPRVRAIMDAQEKLPGIYPLAASMLREPGFSGLGMGQERLNSNRVPFRVDSLPECVAQGTNHSQATAQQVTLPILVNGRILNVGQWDVYCFNGKACDKVVAEVYARRLNSPLDSVLKLTDSSGKQIAFNDDFEDKASGLITHHADSYLNAALPADGVYYLYVGDAQHKSGPEYAYRLRISPSRPDVELRVSPSGINVAGGSTVAFTVFAIRRDGFNEPIDLGFKDAPQGFVLAGARIPVGTDMVRLTLTTPPITTKEPLRLAFEGRTTIDGHPVVRPALPADYEMQAFAYWHIVPATEFLVMVAGRSSSAPVKIVGPIPFKIPAGGTANLKLDASTAAAAGAIAFELSEPPDGITVAKEPPGDNGVQLVIATDATKVKPGLRGNLIVNAVLERGDDAAVKRQRQVLGILPAIPFEITDPPATQPTK